MTEKLYYKSSKIKKFTATVLSCEEGEKYFEAVLDKTAFFPEGGGQSSDTGKIGESRVFDVKELDGIIVHYCDLPLNVGEEYSVEIAWQRRFSFMQNHSGEHIVSGITHALYGYDNVGFHMENDTVTVDFNGELSREQLDEIEKKANEAVFENIDFTVLYPTKDELPGMQYRSKLDLTDNVRIVKIGDIDMCACCAPHVEKSGEIGIIKILDFTRHRGGTRLFMKCGSWALFDYRDKYTSIHGISNLLSVKASESFEAVNRLKEALFTSKRELYEFKIKCVLSDVENLSFDENILIINSCYDGDMLREFVDASIKNGAPLAAAFSGDDESGYMYAALSNLRDMNAFSKEMNGALNGRGGGRNGLIQGRVAANKTEIIKYFNNI